MLRGGANFDKLEMVTTGFTDSIALIAERQVDLVWIYYGWEGIQAEQQGIALNVVMMQDYTDCVPDFYTPVVIASEATIAAKPELVEALLEALSRGYTFAAEHPDEAADILSRAVPELDSTLVQESQRWLSDYYIAEAPRWGQQEEAVWRDYADWMADNGILANGNVAEDAFTNQFLP